MMRFANRVLLSTIALMPLSVAAAAQDANTPPVQAATGGDQTQPEQPADLVVTAAKRQQRLIDVPQSVSVVTGEALEDLHAQRLDDYFNRVPSASINETQAGEARIILRGINTGGDAATVATYVDEVPFGSATSLANGAVLAPDIDPSELQRVEVLRGPQGTLYGANSLGGVVKYVTIAPSFDAVHASGELGVETLAHGDTGWFERLAINVPVTSDLAVRGSGFYRDDAGFIDDPLHGHNVNGDRSYGGRFSALFKPVAGLTLRGTAVLQNIDSSGPNTYDADPVTLAPLLGHYQQDHIVSEPSDVRYRIYNGTAIYDLTGVSLLSSTSWGNLRQAEVVDYSGLLGLPSAINETVSQKRFTEEVRIASTKPGFLEWTVGGFYTHEHDAIGQSVDFDTAQGQPVAGETGLEVVALPENYREVAGFASGTLHLARQFDLTFGGRYSHNKQGNSETIGGPLVGGPIVYTGHSSDNVFTYSVAPSFKPNDHMTIYARVARGYRPGGPNALPPNVPADVPQQFGADTTTNYEVGIKSALADNLLTVELTGFYIDWHRIQLLEAVDNYGVNVNGGNARSKGIEAGATLTPVKGLSLTANGAYVDAYLRDPVASLGAASGDRLPYTGKFSGTLSADYERPLSATVNGTAGVSWRYTGHRGSAFDATYGQHRLGSFSQVDLHAGVTYDHFKLDAFVRNLTDSRGILDVGTAGSSSNPAAIGVAIVRPRSIGLSFGFKG